MNNDLLRFSLQVRLAVENSLSISSS